MHQRQPGPRVSVGERIFRHGTDSFFDLHTHGARHSCRVGHILCFSMEDPQEVVMPNFCSSGHADDASVSFLRAWRRIAEGFRYTICATPLTWRIKTVG